MPKPSLPRVLSSLREPADVRPRGMDFFTIPVVVGIGHVLWFRTCAVVAVVFALVNLADFLAPPAVAERVSITRVAPIQLGNQGTGTRIEAMGTRAREWRIRWNWNAWLKPGMGADITTTAVTGRLRTIHLLNGERSVWSLAFPGVEGMPSSLAAVAVDPVLEAGLGGIWLDCQLPLPPVSECVSGV